MAEKTKKSKPITYVLIIIAAIAISYVLYVYLLNPQMDKRAALEEKVATQRDEVQSLQVKKAALTKTTTNKNATKSAASMTEMAAQVPDGIHLDTLTDDLQAAESSSSTQITNFIFNAYDAQSKVDATMTPMTALTEAEEKGSYAADATPVSDIPKGSLPKYTHLVTVQLAVNAYTEEDVRNFIGQLEQAPRTYIVEKVKFEAPDASDATANDVVAAKIQVTAMYYEAPVVTETKATNESNKKADDTSK